MICLVKETPHITIWGKKKAAGEDSKWILTMLVACLLLVEGVLLHVGVAAVLRMWQTAKIGLIITNSLEKVLSGE